jgi:putative ABC transport system permease protein
MGRPGARRPDVAIVLAIACSIPFVVILVASPFIRRLATRNARRRPIEALLVIGGSLLGTAIITGSLIVGTTINRSIRAAAYDQLGPIDEIVSAPSDQAPALRQRFQQFGSPEFDGKLFMTVAGASVVHKAAEGGTQPRAQLLEVDFGAARRFGGDPGATGISGPTPAPGTAAITQDLANKLNIRPGDHIQVFAAGGSTNVVVDRVLPRRGVAGFWTVDGRQQSYNVFVAPGTIARLATSNAGAVTEPPQAILAFSNVGGVEAGADGSRRAVSTIDRQLGQLTARARPVKKDLLDRATASGHSLTQLYFTVGMFAVAAGVLLLVNVFVMLADERRSELGMLRAMGMRRSRLVGALATEGWFYAVLASALGALLGIGFGWLIAWRAGEILGSGREESALHLTFSFSSSTVIAGFAIGFVISIVTIVASSMRIARFNIIQAIRDTHDAPRLRPRRRWARLGVMVACLGGALTLLGFAEPESYSVMIGPMLVAVGLAPVIARRLPGHAVLVAACTAVLVWAVVSIAVVGSLGIAIEIPMFLVQGFAMAGAGVILITTYLGRVGTALGRGGRGTLAARLGVAYPVARRFRTGMTLAMFAIIILTLVYIGEISYMFQGRADAITSNLSGGFGVVVLSNPGDPVRAAQLAAVPGVRKVAPLGYATAEFTTPTRSRTAWPVTGVGPEVSSSPLKLKDRGHYASDAAVWRAVAEDPHLAIVDDLFLQTPGGPAARAANVGDRISMTDPVTGRSQSFTVAGLAESDFLLSGAYVSEDALTRVFRERAVPSRFFVSAAHPEAAVARIRSSFVANGADAQTVHSIVTTILAQNSGFFTLMQQFVGAGLVVGIAGIGVIMFRAVRERRRQVGVLRSLGFSHGSIGNVFMFEAGFVASLGIALGVVIALIATYVLAVSGADFARGFKWGVPLGQVLVIVAIALVSAMVAALLPARQAARIQPAVSLRVAD